MKTYEDGIRSGLKYDVFGSTTPVSSHLYVSLYFYYYTSRATLSQYIYQLSDATDATSVAEPEPVGAGTFWSEPEPV